MAVCSGRNRIIGSGGILSHMLAKSLASHASIAGRNHALLSKGAGARFQEVLLKKNFAVVTDLAGVKVGQHRLRCYPLAPQTSFLPVSDQHHCIVFV